ncbi:MAG TPA: hypothetical protein VFS21_25790 [Roseiflexaceae bacterium]|nr:hypothetical protein [Roseiflexaceae bacterium]
MARHGSRRAGNLLAQRHRYPAAAPELIRRVPAAFGPWTRPADLLSLQRSVGNQAVQRLLSSTPRPDTGGMPIQRKEVRVPTGSPTASTWTFLRTENGYDVYDDGLPETDLEKLASTREVIDAFNDDLSDAEESDTELDLKAKSGKKKVYRVNNIRDARKVVKIMHSNPTTGIGVRMGGSGAMFRLEGRSTQFYVKTVSKAALKQGDGTQGKGAMPPRGKKDPKPTGKPATYEHVVTELKNYKDVDVAKAIWDKYFSGKAYPNSFSERAQAKMDEMVVLLSLAEPFRAQYAFGLLVASIHALQNGMSMKEVLYQGKGQLEALHVGASSHSVSGVSGQLMEQNMGKGRNDPHPTQKSMSIDNATFKTGAKRTRQLFEAATTKPFGDFLKQNLDEPVRAFKKRKLSHTPTAGSTTVPPTTTSAPPPTTTTVLPTNTTVPLSTSTPSPKTGAPLSLVSTVTVIDGYVAKERLPSGRWDARIVVTLNSGITLTKGQKVQYKGTVYVVKNVTKTGLVLLK